MILPCQDWSELKICSSLGASLGLVTLTLRPWHQNTLRKTVQAEYGLRNAGLRQEFYHAFPYSPIAKLILDKYKGGEKLLPIQDPADINKYLKDIAILCGINKRICFHTSRHTFASTVTLANNISLEVVSKMLGHTNTRMTAHYAKLIDKCIGEQMDKLMDTFTGDSDY